MAPPVQVSPKKKIFLWLCLIPLPQKQIKAEKIYLDLANFVTADAKGITTWTLPHHLVASPCT